MSKKQDNEDRQMEKNHMRQRRALNNALGSILGTQNSQTFLAFGFEDALDLQIERIEGESTALRPNRLDRVDKIENELLKAVLELKDIPPENFLSVDATTDVNTPPDDFFG